MKKSGKTTIGIIGSGASGTACFIQLVIKYIASFSGKKLEIILFDRKRFGPGLAYGTGEEDHLLNTRASLMGIMPGASRHFVEWMGERESTILQEFPHTGIGPDDYPPRILYGEYLRAMLEEHIQKAEEAGIDVLKVKTEVMDAETNPDGGLRITCSEETYPVDFAILATGNPLPSSFEKLEGIEQYIPSPWPAAHLLNTVLNEDATVGIIGSSLTAVDAMITLVDRQHRGKVLFFSLEGLLPRVQSPIEPPFERKFLTLTNARRIIRSGKRMLRLKDLIRLFRKEAEAVVGHKIDWRAENRKGKDPLALMEEDLRMAEEGTSVFQNILYSLRYDSYHFWKLLSPEEKKLYVRWIKTDVDINRHAIPLGNGFKVRNALKSGQVKVIGNSKDVEWNGSRFTMIAEDGESYEADYVVNATGPAASIKKMDDLPFLQKLLKKGYIKEYGAGGLEVDLSSMRVITDHEGPSPFYAIGHPVLGQQLDINALWFNVEQADLLTDDLLQQIQ